MARLKIPILQPVKKVGHHAVNKSTAFGLFVHDHPLGSVLTFLIGIISLGFGIWGVWLALFTDIKPQVAAVVDPTAAALKADGENNTKEIVDVINAHFAAQTPTTTAPPVSISKGAPPGPPSIQTAQNILSSPHIKPAVATIAPSIPSPPVAQRLVKRVVIPIPIPGPRLSPPVYSALTREIPILVESGYSAHDSRTAANILHDELSGDFNVVESQPASILIKVEDIQYPPCSFASSMNFNADETFNCTLIIHIVAEYPDKKKIFSKYFQGSEPSNSQSYDDAINDAVSQAYNYISDLVKN
jgi:hypothetical protein